MFGPSLKQSAMMCANHTIAKGEQLNWVSHRTLVHNNYYYVHTINNTSYCFNFISRAYIITAVRYPPAYLMWLSGLRKKLRIVELSLSTNSFMSVSVN